MKLLLIPLNYTRIDSAWLLKMNLDITNQKNNF
jgi:hypothetical protein